MTKTLDTNARTQQVRAKYLKGALNRFARFFSEPLMKADSMGRELEAVDSEFVQARTNDGARLEQLLFHLAKDKHVTRNFSWGNRLSILGKDESPEAYVHFDSRISTLSIEHQKLLQTVTKRYERIFSNFIASVTVRTR